MKGTHMSYLLPRPHLRGSDLITMGGQLPVTIKKFGMVMAYDRKVDEEVEKGALFFQEDQRYLIVNETQLEQIAKILNTEILEEWIGKKVVLVHKKIKVAGEMKDAIRVQAFTGQAQPAPQPAANGNGHSQPAQPPKADPAITWHDSGEERWKAGKVRTNVELRELRMMLGIDDDQIRSWVAENSGDISLTYDAVLKQYADLIMQMGTKKAEESDGSI